LGRPDFLGRDSPDLVYRDLVYRDQVFLGRDSRDLDSPDQVSRDQVFKGRQVLLDHRAPQDPLALLDRQVSQVLVFQDPLAELDLACRDQLMLFDL